MMIDVLFLGIGTWHWGLSALYHRSHILKGSIDSRPCISGNAIASILTMRTGTVDVAAFNSRKSQLLQVWQFVSKCR